MKIFQCPDDHPEVKANGRFRYAVFSGLWEAIRQGEAAIKSRKQEIQSAWKEAVAQATGRKRPPRIDNISTLSRDLFNVVLNAEPSLNFEKKIERCNIEDAVTLDIPTALTGDERCGYRWDRTDQDRPAPGHGDAFRVLICTDVASAAGVIAGDSTAVMLTVCDILMQLGPVEFWVQQGWHGNRRKNPISVSLFKLNFNGRPAPHQLWFWLSSEYKDHPFSSTINSLECGGSGTSRKAIIESDIFIGDDFGFRHHVEANIHPAEIQIRLNKCGHTWTGLKRKEPAFYAKVLEMYAGFVIQQLGCILEKNNEVPSM